MKTVLWFYLLVCCGAAEGYTDKPVDLGQNVTLDCEMAVKDVLWFLMKPSEPPVFILRSFTKKPADLQYGNPTFNKTFSVGYNSSLFIHHISTDKLGMYYCIQPGTPYINSGIRLYLHNHSAVYQTSDECGESRLRTILIVSVIMNVALACAVTVFTVRHSRRTPKIRTQPPEPGLQLDQDNPSPVYSEVQLIRTNGPIRTSNVNNTYALLKTRRDPTRTSYDVSSGPERSPFSAATDM